MKNLRKLSGLALALLGGAPCAVWAQPIPIPGAAMPLPPAAAAPVVGPAAGQTLIVNPQRNLWAFFALSPQQKAACKSRFCNSQFGRLINNTMGPVSVFTGGVLPQCCPPIDPLLQGLPATDAQGAAARIQKDTAEAAARRVAIRYLSTVDCNWWPEATAALSNGVRADRNECVRLEAALALTRGCCCNPVTIKALVNALSVFPDDNNPREDSPRVRAAAMAALDHCLSCYVGVAAAPPPGAPGAAVVPVPVGPGGERPLVPKKPPEELAPPTPAAPDAQPGVKPATYRAAVPQQSMEQVVQQARRVLQQAKEQQAARVRHTPVGSYQPGDRCLLEVIENALHPVKPPQPVITTSYVVPAQVEVQQGNFAAPPLLKPVPQYAPTSVLPQQNVIPAVNPPPLAAPAPSAPVSLTPSQPSAAVSTVAKPASRPREAKVYLEPSLAPPDSMPSSSGSKYATISSVPKPSPAQVHSPAPLVPPTPALDAPIVYESVRTAASKPVGTAVAKSAEFSASEKLSQPSPRSAPSPISVERSTATKPTYAPSVAPAVLKPAEAHVKLPTPAPMPTMAGSIRPTAAPSASGSSSYAHAAAHITLEPATKPVHPTADTASVHTSTAASAPTAALMPTSSSQPPSIYQLLEMLRSSPQPKTRQWAAKSLSAQATASPTVVKALMSGASADSSDEVRDSCLQGLLQLGVYDPVLLAKVDWPRIDGDPRVREAVWQSILFGTETRENPRVRDGAKALNQWFRSRGSVLRVSRS